MSLYDEYDNESSSTCHRRTNASSIPSKFCLEQSLQIHFIAQVQNKDIITQLDKLNNDTKNNTDIYYAVEKFREIVLSVAEK